MFKESRIFIHEKTTILADSWYQGIQNIHKNSLLPHKKSKKIELTVEQKEENKKLSKVRIFVENINRKCKIFRIVKEVFRGKHKNYSKNWSLIAALVNLRYWVS